MFKMMEGFLGKLLGVKYFADDDEGGGDGDGKENKGGVSQEAFDKLQADHDAMTKENEDLRLEIFTPEYTNFLDGKKEPTKKEVVKKDDGISDDAFEKLSKKELFEKAKFAAIADLQGKMDTDKTERETIRNADTKKEIARFARTHDDFTTYRPTMYGLSMDPKNEDLSLQELYEKAKSHVKEIHTGVSEVEKKRQQKIAGEKPGSNAEAFEKNRKLSSDEAASDALSEVKEKLGPIPTE